MATLDRVRTVGLALSRIGDHEAPAGSNRTMYGEWFGYNAVPWCAIFLSWVLDRAGNASGYRFASTASSVAWARSTGRLVPLGEALPGDVLVRLYSTTTGHTGMAAERPAGGVVVTVEGNTSDANARDGGSVMARRRSLNWWHYCIRIDYPEPAAPVTIGGSHVFNPALNLPAIVAEAPDPTNGGVWLLGVNGAVYAFGGARYLGGMNGSQHFTGRAAAELAVGTAMTPKEASERADGYVIVDARGERYGPLF